MLKVIFIKDALFIEDRDDHLIGLTSYSSNYKTITIHAITDDDLDALIIALMREEFERKANKGRNDD